MATILALAQLLAFAAGPALADDMSLICDRAAVLAAARTDVPVSVLKAISLTETGRSRDGATRPWPWTVNMEGEGLWFDTADAALAYAQEHFKRGARSFDIGCFQINYKWHHQHFASIEAMFDPAQNALYAARFLGELFAESGDWEKAAGAYHSRTPEFADRYRARFAAFRAGLQHEDALPLRVAEIDPAGARARPSPADTPRINSFPLLQSGGEAALGSLVPLGMPAVPGGLFGQPSGAGT
ncbi:transglycosylase SLT domain-containing protein [Sinisalibacter aestuarii]|uniref:Lytic transglycosylase n=1 Tax=Sinisalibacter aestuarii TaxID=2949426 RepID=A0ABQ5LQK1_9RHOB|nr:transglycosylase SLT domain-containing protein [Sinisalibacter aestuarii]GKY86680.1 lytic transglycosylase [Sinisalibacter aestuarii]